MTNIEQHDFSTPDEVRAFEHGKLELVKVSGGGSVGRFTLEPGWRWSTDVKPLAKTELCQSIHFGYHVSGRLHLRLADGHECEAGPGQVVTVPAGHDAWVVGNDPVVLIDWAGATDYAKR